MKKLDKDLLETTLRDRAEGYINDHTAGGIVMLVNQNGERIASICAGMQDPDKEIPVSEDTFFRVASMTKSVTGVAAVIAAELGYFRLDDPVSDYFPDYADKKIGHIENGQLIIDGSAKTQLRIYHLLTHSSGLITSEETGQYQMLRYPPSAFESIESIVDYTAKNAVLAFEPMSRSCYSAFFAFDTVARIIEIKSGISYAEFLDKYIFAPLGIKDITFTPTEEQWDRMSAAYDITDSRLRMVTVNMGRKNTFEGFPLSYTCAGASLAATPEAYLRFAELLRGRGELDGVRIYKDSSADLINHRYVPHGTPGLCENESWGLGVRVITAKDLYIPENCFGWSGAYGTHFWVDPENDITAIIMKNNRWYDAGGCGDTGVQFEIDVYNCLK